MIQLESVTKSYGTSVVVDGVTLTLTPGGITSLIGPNGAGKSTLLGIMARLLSADHGSARVADLDVAQCDSRELARILAVLKQDNHLTVRLRVGELVAFGRYPHSQGRLTGHDRQVVEAALAYLDLTGLRDRYLDELSGGQRQRAFVAMVLAQDTDYLLLDEPLNNLDLSHSRAMMAQLRRAADELGKTIVVVVHDINFASCWSDRIVALRDGRVLAEGPPAEIVTDEVLSEVFGTPLRVHQIDGQRLAWQWT
ncbi:iron ABC transporter ATP-binding protein [Enemella evansiae]|uniref:iron ABC transporter ATP-binding protein n=1 Tax=Enemella evansiae TaxID=2016499 RepID=UPI000B96ED91|nr:ATP-binding cassette domain-containing protein [Enemella evansiae]OYN99141.1 iron ABC transporter ATP-binding protein [Enemella evansiae]OYO05231.1 iron ABC transporter ATP-binding protein [Enemella evansiae]OYO15628.1 iron ABC transporter ATP-binding protein [Enemella evansiae]PFG67319.1 iron complex transport system ATP-binding protein [Propionibacteriaceae bacterium ES.041]